MKRLTLLAVMAFFFAVPSLMTAQELNHVEFGGFVDYLWSKPGSEQPVAKTSFANCKP